MLPADPVKLATKDDGEVRTELGEVKTELRNELRTRPGRFRFRVGSPAVSLNQ